MAGLTDTGIEIKDVTEILSDIESEQIANIDADLDTTAAGVLGQLNGIIAAALAEPWELIEDVYHAAYPDTASGQPLAYIAALTGALKQSATKATLAVHLEGTATTVVPTGTRCYPDGDPDSLFETTAPATIAEEGTPDFVAVTMQAVTEGTATTVGSGDTLVISTPVAGLDAITIDGTITFAEAWAAGTDEELDSELRIRREQTLAIAGASTVEAIRAEMLTVTGVDSCTVFANPTGEVDALGLPPSSIEVMLNSETAPDYDAQEVVDEILLRKPAGTETFGGLSGTGTDSSGNEYTVYYSEPTTVRTYVELTIVAGADYVAGTVESAIANWATASLLVGQSIYASDIINVTADVTGVTSVTVSTVLVDDIASPVTVDLILTARQLGTIASNDVTVTS